MLLTEGTGTTTRGVAYEAVTFRSEPFPVVSPYNWNADKSNTRDQAEIADAGAHALAADVELRRAVVNRRDDRFQSEASHDDAIPDADIAECRWRIAD